MEKKSKIWNKANKNIVFLIQITVLLFEYDRYNKAMNDECVYVKKTVRMIKTYDLTATSNPHSRETEMWKGTHKD